MKILILLIILFNVIIGREITRLRLGRSETNNLDNPSEGVDFTEEELAGEETITLGPDDELETVPFTSTVISEIEEDAEDVPTSTQGPEPPPNTMISPPGFEPSPPAILSLSKLSNSSKINSGNTGRVVDVSAEVATKDEANESEANNGLPSGIDGIYGNPSEAVESSVSSASFGDPLSLEWPEALSTGNGNSVKANVDGSGAENEGSSTVANDVLENGEEGSGSNLAPEDEAFLSKAISKISGEINSGKDCVDKETGELKEASAELLSPATESSLEPPTESMTTTEEPQTLEGEVVDEPEATTSTIDEEVSQKKEAAKTFEKRVHKYTFGSNGYDGATVPKQKTGANRSSENLEASGTQEQMVDYFGLTKPRKTTTFTPTTGQSLSEETTAEEMSGNEVSTENTVIEQNESGMEEEGGVTTNEGNEITEERGEEKETIEETSGREFLGEKEEQSESLGVEGNQIDEEIFSTTSNIFEATNVYDNTKDSKDMAVHAMNHTKALRGAVEGCPAPKLCGKNCFVFINEEGCQDCQCLWISLDCVIDADCPEDFQYCDIGKCQCKVGFVQDMKKSGLCMSQQSSLTEDNSLGEFLGSEAEFQSVHGSSASKENYDNNKESVGVEAFEKETSSLPTTTTQMPSTAIYPGLYFGRSRNKRGARSDSRSRRSRQNEGLQWPGPCDDDQQCPPNLYCIQGDCWHLPDKPIRSFLRENKNDLGRSIIAAMTSVRPESPDYKIFPTTPRTLLRDRPEQERLRGRVSQIERRRRPTQILPPGFEPNSGSFETSSAGGSFAESIDGPVQFDDDSKEVTRDPNIRMIEVAGPTDSFIETSTRVIGHDDSSEDYTEEIRRPPLRRDPPKRAPTFTVTDNNADEEFMSEFLIQKENMEAVRNGFAGGPRGPPPNSHFLDERRKSPKQEEHIPGIWYEMTSGDMRNNHETVIPPRFDAPKRNARLFYEYTSNNILNKPIRILVDHARGLVRDECLRDGDCSLRTKCCEKKWCDRSGDCGKSRFCLPDCSMTKVSHLSDTRDQEPGTIDVIYD